MASSDIPLINNVFVLMLENHSFDHLLGFSGIIGKDAYTGEPRTIDGLTGAEKNTWNGEVYPVEREAEDSMPVDPGHEFDDTFLQLTGKPYTNGATYQTVDNSGFVADYATKLDPAVSHTHDEYNEIMRCFTPDQLPVLNALAREFCVCDRWFASMPGPTCPNRLFVHAASSGGLDHSPQSTQILAWLKFGLEFQHGTIYDQLTEKFDNPYRIYRGDNFVTDDFPNVAQIKGISSLDAHSIKNFKADVSAPNYNWPFTFIEPSYGNLLNNSYKGGTSMHPMDDVTGGEALIKEVYEAIRQSPIWENSVLIVVWDEHGGFYDHVAPPKAIAPGDETIHGGMNKYGFDFTQYGVRVPAVIVSPLVPKGVIDHTLYDHSSIPKTIQDIFALNSMTNRDKNANSLFSLLNSLDAPRTDALETLPEPLEKNPILIAPSSIANMASPANDGSLPLFLHAALKTDLEISPATDQQAIEEQFSMIHTRQDAADYINHVQGKMS